MKIKEKELEKILEELKSIAMQMDTRVRFERGDFKGGYCVLKESRQIVINKLSNLQRKVMILATGLKEIGIDEIYLTPRMREIIEEMDLNNHEDTDS